jgi:hypothetical protein
VKKGGWGFHSCHCVDAALERLPKPSNAEELIRTVYQVQREKRE